MKINDIIRQKRLEKGFTQEQVVKKFKRLLL